jgi:hypothetical protein
MFRLWGNKKKAHPVNHSYRPAYKPLYEAALRDRDEAVRALRVAQDRLSFFAMHCPEWAKALADLEGDGNAACPEEERP